MADPLAAHPAVREAFQQREMSAERQINRVRSVLFAVAAVGDALYAYAQGRLDGRLAPVAVSLIGGFSLYAFLVDRMARGNVYRPWLKFVTVTLDYGLTLLVFWEYRRIGFFVDQLPGGGVSEVVGFLVLLNFLSAFRHGRALILYSTALATALGMFLTQRFSGSIEMAFYTPTLLVASGVLTSAFSTGLTRVFVRLRQREQLTRFLPQQVVQGIDAGRIRVDLGGVKQSATILLSDIRGFTTFAEDRDAAEVVGFLNEYFTAMARVIWRYGGTIDKFMGDAMLAGFGVPVSQVDHAARALHAAVRMREVLGDLNRQWAARGIGPIRAGVAVHSGKVLAGNVGAAERMEYTIIGDAVNVTARIEELNKHYGTDLLISDSTYEQVKEQFALEPVGTAPLRGRHEAVRLYTLAEGK